MASVLVPIATQVVPLVIPTVVRWIERLFGAKTGETKKSAAVDIVKIVLDNLQKVLGPSVSLPTDKSSIAELVQSSVDQLNAQGALKGSATALDPAAATTDQIIAAAHGSAVLLLEAALASLRAAQRPNAP